MPFLKDEEGNWIDVNGKHVPPEYVPKHAIKVDKMVMEAAETILALYEAMVQAKEIISSNINNHLVEMATENGVELDNQKGYTWYDFSGFYKLKLKIGTFKRFDERLHIAEQKLKTIVEEWAIGAVGEKQIKTLALDAFESNKDGLINPNKIFQLMKLLQGFVEENPGIGEVINLINESLYVHGRKDYYSLEIKQEDGSWKSIVLNFARI